MINLLNTSTDKLQVTTDTAATIDVHASWADLISGTVTAGRTNTAISSASTPDIVATPAGGVRNVKTLNIYNKDAALSCNVTVIYNANGTSYTLYKANLGPGEALEYVEGVGFFEIAATNSSLRNYSTTSQSGFSADTYLIGSNVSLPTAPTVGTIYRLIFDVAKTGVGTATPIINVRFGTAASVLDTSRCTFTFGAGTGVIDVATVECLCLFRTVGSGSSGIIQGQARATTNLTTTGWSNAVKALQATSGAGFDSTLANAIIGVSYNGGASAAHTVQLVRAEVVYQ